MQTLAVPDPTELDECDSCQADQTGLSSSVTTNFKAPCWEDNEGAWTLADLDPGQHAPRSKFHNFTVPKSIGSGL